MAGWLAARLHPSHLDEPSLYPLKYLTRSIPLSSLISDRPRVSSKQIRDYLSYHQQAATSKTSSYIKRVEHPSRSHSFEQSLPPSVSPVRLRLPSTHLSTCLFSSFVLRLLSFVSSLVLRLFVFLLFVFRLLPISLPCGQLGTMNQPQPQQQQNPGNIPARNGVDILGWLGTAYTPGFQSRSNGSQEVVAGFDAIFDAPAPPQERPNNPGGH